LKKKINILKYFIEGICKNKKRVSTYLAAWLDVIFLIPGMVCITIGVFKIYIPAGDIMMGLCFIALAFFIGKKQAGGGK